MSQAFVTNTSNLQGDEFQDRVHWGPIIAGLFAAMSVLAVLGVLGLAVGLSSVDVGDNPNHFGIGAGIWGGVSGLIAFFFGGWIAARTTTRQHHHTGLLQGSMVWMVAIPLMMYLIAGGIGSIAQTATTAASNAVGVAGAGSAQVASDPTARQNMQNTVQQKMNDVQNAANDPANARRMEESANSAGYVAWGTLVSLLVSRAAATLGGHFGSRRHEGNHLHSVDTLAGHRQPAL